MEGSLPQPEVEAYPWSRSRLQPNEPFVMILTRNERRFEVCKPGGAMVNKFGTFAFDDIAGEEFGSQWVSRTAKQKLVRGTSARRRTGGPASKKKGEAPLPIIDETIPLSKRGKLCVLSCTPELWSRTLLHRTQIIYPIDASLVCFHLDLKPGSVVIESGTGSGSLSLAIARCVAPSGHVHTFEFNNSRVVAAQKDFDLLLGSVCRSIITVRECDALGDEGFTGVEDLADAVFLDLPKPWGALKNCVRALKKDCETRICCFSPCIEQVSKTCAEMRALGGFFLIRTFEVVGREMETHRLQERVPGMWEGNVTTANELRTNFDPATKSGNTSFNPSMATHTGYLTFASRFPSPPTVE